MRPLTVGDRIKDNDPRMPGRVGEILSFALGEGGPTRAQVKFPCSTVWMKVERIFIDEKVRRTGFSRVNPS